MLLPSRATLKPLLEEQKFQSAKEGLALAQKVDALRKEYNQLQKNRDEFVAGTIKEIEKATKTKSDQLNSLQGQIEVLEAKRKELLKPLNAEWKELELSKKDFEKQKNYILLKESQVNLAEQILTEKIKSNKKIEDRNNLIQEQFKRLLDEVKTEKLDADNILKDTKANRDEIEKECADRLIKVSELENKADFNRQANENERKNFEKYKKEKEQELNDRERQINDKYNILLRIKKRGK